MPVKVYCTVGAEKYWKPISDSKREVAFLGQHVASADGGARDDLVAAEGEDPGALNGAGGVGDGVIGLAVVGGAADREALPGGDGERGGEASVVVDGCAAAEAECCRGRGSQSTMAAAFWNLMVPLMLRLSVVMVLGV